MDHIFFKMYYNYLWSFHHQVDEKYKQFTVVHEFLLFIENDLAQHISSTRIGI